VTAALSDAMTPDGGWTTDDLDTLPGDQNRRELIDGVLIATPSPGHTHQTMASMFLSALMESCPADFYATQAVDVRVNSRRSLVPDVLVVTADAAARMSSKFPPTEVILAVEIVSPGSVTLDRFAKPALYAEAGIPFYWRIETFNGVEVHTHRLNPINGTYVADGLFTTLIEVAEPWPIKIPVSRFTPRFFPQPE
jgi:Uma2 family endonuclease